MAGSHEKIAELGVIGLGKMGLLHAGIFSALQDHPIAVASEEDRLLARISRRIMPKAHIYRDYNEMITKEPLDGVIITTPVHTHAGIILDIMEKKPDLSIFVEEPLASTYDDARKICDASRKSTGIHMVGFQRRHLATFRRAKEMLANGNLGSPWHFKSYCFMSNVFKKEEGWRFKKATGGGVMLEVGPHLLDLILWIFGEPIEVAGVNRKFYSEEVEDYVHSTMRFPKDLIGYADISWSVRNFRIPDFFIEVEATNGKLEVSDSFLTVQLDSDGPDLAAGTHVFSRPAIQPSVPFLLGGPEFCLEDGEFLSLLNSRREAESNFLSAARVNLWIDRIRDS